MSRKGTAVSKIPGKDNFHRLNFLYQAAHHASTTPSFKGDLSAYYGHLMCAVSRKAVLKIEPDVKRGICKGCCIILQPGVTARVRVRKARIIWTCLRCGTLKRFPTKKGYKLWIDNDEACLDIIEIPIERFCENAVTECRQDKGNHDGKGKHLSSTVEPVSLDKQAYLPTSSINTCNTAS